MSNRLAWRFALAICALGSTPGFGQLPLTELTTVYPPGTKPGTTLDVTVAGGNQEDLTALKFSHPGITAKQKQNPAPEFLKDPVPVNNTFSVTVAADVAPGVYEVRAVGRFGTSSPRGFVVGELNEIMDDGSNATLATAKKVPVGSTINGRADANVINYFKVTLKAGQQVLIDCFAQRIDSRLNATLEFYDTQGKLLRRVRDSIGDDPLIGFHAPADGDYVVLRLISMPGVVWLWIAPVLIALGTLMAVWPTRRPTRPSVPSPVEGRTA